MLGLIPSTNRYWAPAVARHYSRLGGYCNEHNRDPVLTEASLGCGRCLQTDTNQGNKK